MIMRRALIPLLFWLAGCATRAPERSGPLLTPPLPPASLGQELAQSELVTGEHDGRSYAMRVELEVNAERLVVVGLSPAGVPLFTLEQTAGGVSVEGGATGRLPFDPAYMLSDLQLIHWPADVLAPAMAARGLRFEERDGRRRVSERDGRPLVDIAYHGAITLTHLDRPYRLRIETIGR
jgi:hypothetical protein